jgi:hypothetical protein
MKVTSRSMGSDVNRARGGEPRGSKTPLDYVRARRARHQTVRSTEPRSASVECEGQGQPGPTD